MIKMKYLFAIFLFLFLQNSFATTYYVNSATGGDGNSGTSTGTAWQTLSKVNSFSFSPGDNILFQRGQNWTGTLTISNSGTSGNPITFGAYGTGANPVITGLQGVSSWTNLGSNIWESATVVSTLPTCNMVVINGVNTAMGRYPNTGYLTYQSHSGYTSLTSSSLTGTPDWTHAGIVVKRNRYNITVDSITAQSGGTLTFTNNSGMTSGLNDGFGFFIQDDIRTLDTANEWYYNPTTQKLDIYSVGTPSYNVQIATVQNLLIFSGNRSYITISGIDFVGANGSAIYISSTGTGVTIQNCNVSFTGSDAIYVGYSTNAIIQNNTISYSNGNAIRLNGNSTTPSILNNTIKSTGVFPGMYNIGYAYGAITSDVDSCLVQYNNIDSSGYNGIIAGGVNMHLYNNFINHSCLVKDDGGGIYISGGSSGDSPGKQLIGNIILNTQSDLTGTNAPNDPMGMGIYLDSYSHGVLVQGNTVSGCWASGGFFSDLDSNFIRDNIFYNNSTFPTGFSSKSEVMIQYICCNTVFKNNFYNNVMVSKLPTKYALFYYTVSDSASIRNFGTMDSNYYAKPASASPIRTQIGSTSTDRSLVQWQGFGFDAHSNSLNISDTSKLRLVYNASASSSTIGLGAMYSDIRGNTYNGAITLSPYKSEVLIYSGAIVQSAIPYRGILKLK